MDLTLHELETPALLLDRARLDRNIAQMHARIRALGASLRPHVKTSKSIDVVRRALAGEPGGITVSTLKEAEYFLDCGIRDIVYAVGLAPCKLKHVVSLISRGARLSVIVDNLAIIAAISAVAGEANVVVPVLIEIDVDGHRSGVPPDSTQLVQIGAAVVAAPGVKLRGVLTHAGESYNCTSPDGLRGMAEQERSGAVRAAERLRAAGIEVADVSVGSTPTSMFAQSLAGVTEVRAGVYMFQDLVMAGIGVCSVDAIALSVLVSVIGHRPDKGWIITDGGWMALSRDHGTSSQGVDQGYGLVRDVRGRALSHDFIVRATNQEHGIVGRRDGLKIDPLLFPVGTLLRVLPNHACATAAQFTQYQVVENEEPVIRETWSRFGGW